MAENVKGITIELAADATGVKKAFKELTKESRSVETQLKDVNKALKFDPTNVDLLEAKQKLLNDAIDKTKGQIEKAKEAQEAFIESGGDVNSSQYIQMQIETARLEGHLSSLEDQSDDVATALINAGDSADTASGEVGSFSDAAEEYTQQVDDAADSTDVWSVAIGNLIAAGMEKLIDTTIDAAKGIFGLSDNVNTLANNYGISQEAAYALYQNQELLDYSVSSVTRMIKEQYKELADGTDAYDALGIAVKDANGDLLSQEEIFTNTLAYLRGIEDPVERAAKGTELLGNKYYDLGGIMKSSDKDFAKFTKAIRNDDAALRDNLDTIGSVKDAVDGAVMSITDMTMNLGELFTWLSQLQGILPALLVIVGGLSGAWLAFGGAAKIAAAGQAVLNAVMAANPIGFVILAVTALVATFMLLWNNCEGFRNFFIGMWSTIKDKSTAGAAVVKEKFTETVQEFKDRWEYIKGIFSDAVDVGRGIVDDIVKGIKGSWSELTSLVSGAWGKLKDLFSLEVTAEETPSGVKFHSHKTGLNYVPYDEYPAYLHEGEAVLTKSEATAWRNGSNTSQAATINIYTQEMTESQVDYLVNRVNVILGGA